MTLQTARSSLVATCLLSKMYAKRAHRHTIEVEGASHSV